MKAIRTVVTIEEYETTPPCEPQFNVGDYCEVYCGHFEGHSFYINDVRWNEDRKAFEYLYLYFIWLDGGSIVRLHAKEASNAE
ncbi:hypothetical protein FHW00_004638 [Ochrobactrum sp. P6BSIII]|nr:hypothetical protein [Ochrobactrum sp. P6BSIII]